MEKTQVIALENLPLPALTERLAKAFAARGHQLYLVGGPVRDWLLGRPTNDLDFTTAARPPETRACLNLARPHAIFDVGEKFGTLGAVFPEGKVEITTFRGEQYSEGSRKPTVAYGVDLRGDLARRDLTINAMALDVASGELHDPFGGRADLERQVVRAVGDPAERFREDPLRLLRAVRFAVTLDFELDPETARAIKEEAPQLASISRERISEELNRILTVPQPSRGVRLLVELGLMEQFIPEFLRLRGVRQEKTHRHKDVYEHTLAVLDRAPAELPVRLSALLHDIAKPQTFSVVDGAVHFYGHEIVGERVSRQILTRLHYPTDTIQRVARLVGLHMRANSYSEDWTDGALRRFIREADSELEDLLKLSAADVTSRRPERVAEAQRRIADLSQRAHALIEAENTVKLSSPLNGHELMALFGRGPGPWLGPLKNHLLDLVLDGQLAPDDKQGAAEAARRFMAEQA